MGYTHYWRGTATASSELVGQLQHLLESTDVPLAGGYGDAATRPEIDAEHIRFNGVEDDSHETFMIEFGLETHDFCKTARKPYDDVVVAALILITEASGGTFSWSSDGNDEDHAAGRETALTILGHL